MNVTAERKPISCSSDAWPPALARAWEFKSPHPHQSVQCFRGICHNLGNRALCLICALTLGPFSRATSLRCKHSLCRLLNSSTSAGDATTLVNRLGLIAADLHSLSPIDTGVLHIFALQFCVDRLALPRPSLLSVGCGNLTYAFGIVKGCRSSTSPAT